MEANNDEAQQEKKQMGFNCGLMALNMKGCGVEIRQMGKEE